MRGDLDALAAMGSALGYELPQEPRVLLLAPDQMPSTEQYAVMDLWQGNVPAVESERDIVVRLRPEHATREIDERMLTRSVAWTMAEAMQGRRNDRLTSKGKRLLAAGITLGGLAAAADMAWPSWPAKALAGAGGLTLGAGGVVCERAGRRRAQMPDAEAFEPPIRVMAR